MDNLSEKLKNYRVAQNISLRALAQAMGVSTPTVWAWEHARTRPRPDRLAALAEILKVPVEVLYSNNSTSTEQAEVVRECKERIANAFGLDPAAVRIKIDL